jgi:hypothetical protein
MRRPGVRFWRVVFVASVVLFVAGVAVTVVATRATKAVYLTRRTSVFYGHSNIGISRNQPGTMAHGLANGFVRQVRDGLAGQTGPPYRWRPWYRRLSRGFIIIVPAQYICLGAALTAIAAGALSRRQTRRCGQTQCIACGYALAGLPADAAACPECGGKIEKSTA